ncbi:MAG: hypothetical protein E6J91_16325 [Deltaproteobacteria bacterium]|nr:MAG: hypothetical protein E6J91_16325 [Deltaproteobacteria bacterium]
MHGAGCAGAHANPSNDLEQCSTQSVPVVITPAAQLTLGGQCLTAARVADVGWVLDLEPCHSGSR